MIVNYLHQRLPFPMAVPERDGQVMVLGFSKFRSRQELTFLFSSKNTLVVCKLQRKFSNYKVAVNDFAKFLCGLGERWKKASCLGNLCIFCHS